MAFLSHAEGPAAYLYLNTLSHVEAIRIMSDNSRDATDLSCWSVAQSNLERKMLKLRNRFDRREELGGLSHTKIWGLAAYRDHIASCITLHPGDMAEYYIPSQERATIVFGTHEVSHSESRIDCFPWEVEVKSAANSAAIQSAILDTVLKYEQHENLVHSDFSKKIIYATIMASTLLRAWDGNVSERFRLAEGAAHRLSRSAEIDLSAEMECLKACASSWSVEDCVSTKAQDQQTTGRRSEENLGSSPASPQLIDKCTFCGKTIAWKSLTEATCLGGHPFGKFCQKSHLKKKSQTEKNPKNHKSAAA